MDNPLLCLNSDHDDGILNIDLRMLKDLLVVLPTKNKYSINCVSS